MFQHYRNQFVIACECIFCNTFSGLAVIKLILEMPNFLEIICLKCQNLRKLRGKSMKSGGNLRASFKDSPPLQHRYPINVPKNSIL